MKYWQNHNNAYQWLVKPIFTSISHTYYSFRFFFLYWRQRKFKRPLKSQSGIFICVTNESRIDLLIAHQCVYIFSFLQYIYFILGAVHLEAIRVNRENPIVLQKIFYYNYSVEDARNTLRRHDQCTTKSIYRIFFLTDRASESEWDGKKTHLNRENLNWISVHEIRNTCFRTFTDEHSYGNLLEGILFFELELTRTLRL